MVAKSTVTLHLLPLWVYQPQKWGRENTLSAPQTPAPEHARTQVQCQATTLGHPHHLISRAYPFDRITWVFCCCNADIPKETKWSKKVIKKAYDGAREWTQAFYIPNHYIEQAAGITTFLALSFDCLRDFNLIRKPGVCLLNLVPEGWHIS